MGKLWGCTTPISSFSEIFLDKTLLKITYFNPLFLHPFFMMLFLLFNILFSQNTVAIEWPFRGIYL